MAACLNDCSNDPNCEGVGYDTSTGTCYEYCSEVSNSGSYSTNVQFAQLKQRAVVKSGTTYTFPITTSLTSNGINVQGGTTFPYTPTSSLSSALGGLTSGITATSPSSGLGGLTSGLTTSTISNLGGLTSGLATPTISNLGGLTSGLLNLGGVMSTSATASSAATISSGTYPSSTSSSTSGGLSFLSGGFGGNQGVSTVSSLSSATVPTSAGPTETAASYSCPANDGQTVIENGNSYVIGCGGSLTGTYYTIGSAARSFSDCFASCDQSSTSQGAKYCTGFSYVGSTNGDGPGTCYLYNNVGNGMVATNSSSVAAARLVNYVAGALPSGSAGVGAGITGVSANLPSSTISPPVNTCTNGGDPLNGCVAAVVTATPAAGASGGLGLTGSSTSTISNVQASVTAIASLSASGSAGLGLSLGSSGPSVSATMSLGIGLSGTLEAGATGTLLPSGSSALTSTSVVSLPSTSTAVSFSITTGLSSLPLTSPTLSINTNTGQGMIGQSAGLPSTNNNDHNFLLERARRPTYMPRRSLKYAIGVSIYYVELRECNSLHSLHDDRNYDDNDK
ncbi:hypothetical protein LTR78_000207 [Recurvomyces mirabilis]|uniref:Apple domain-containing protein n=1 Tax=Recurvomyces mirabilis TaxID=574656 RepID=A0AAE0WXP9_9PEZI|nr:hypothetical protein LTR78_000207 [Recurvomyces mirabilis]KAK5161864.1 hypothetical protein LTS14_000209 [Recurvomyces mirabilis]